MFVPAVVPARQTSRLRNSRVNQPLVRALFAQLAPQNVTYYGTCSLPDGLACESAGKSESRSSSVQCRWLRTERHLQQAQCARGDRISIDIVAVFDHSARVWDRRVYSLLSDSQLHRELLCERPALQ